MDYDEILAVMSISEVLEASGISETEVLHILISEGYIELPEYVRRLATKTFEETEETEETFGIC